MAIISAPALIMSMDDSCDITFFYGENEEEEKENFKLLFEINSFKQGSSFIDNLNASKVVYIYKIYAKPHLNLISPPPEFI